MANSNERRMGGGAPAGRLFFAVLVFFFLAVPAFIELVLAISLGVRVYVAYGALCGILVLALRAPRRTSVVVFVPILLGLTILCATPWTSRKVFLRHFDQIGVGMSPEEVVAIMRGYEYGEVARGPDSIVRTFTHSRSGRFDSDWGVVTFVNGRVVKVEFLPD